MATFKEGGTFETFNDVQGNPLIALNRDGTISSQGIGFPDGSKQTSASSGGGNNNSITINAQAGTTYTIQNSDAGALITFSNTSAVAVSLSQAGTGGQFAKGWFCYVENLNTGLVTITPSVSTISSFPQIVLAQFQWALIISDGTNYDAFFTKISSPSAASALSAYVVNDAGTAVAPNQIVMIDRGTTTVNTMRKGLNVYLETNAAATSGNTDYNGLQINVGATVDANTSATNVRHVEAAEFYTQASGSGVTLSQINGIKVRTSVLSGTTVGNVVGVLNYLPVINGTAIKYSGFEIDAPVGGGTITNFTGVFCDLNLGGVSCTTAFGGIFGVPQAGGATTSSAILLDDVNPTSGSIAFGSPTTFTIHCAIYSGTGTPAGVVTANIGSLFLRQDGGASTTLYVKESGNGTTAGWVAK